MTNEFALWMLYFTVYSVLGYVIEVVLCSIAQKKYVGRGFLFGPVVPIYGFGSFAIMFSTTHVQHNFILTFLVSMLVCSVIEYFTGLALEKMYHIRWWDYSKSDKINLHGRICLRNSLLFGLGGCWIVYSAQPFISGIIALLSPSLATILATVALVAFILDTIASTYATTQARDRVDFNKIIGDQTNEIKKACRQAIKEIFINADKRKQKRRAFFKYLTKK